MRIYQKTCFALVGLIAVLPLPVTAQSSPNDVWRACIVAQETPEGTWVASRQVSDGNGQIKSSRDEYEWQPSNTLNFGPGMTLKWDMRYYWQPDIATQRSIPEQEIIVTLNFRFEPQAGNGPPRKPQRTWLHLYRTANVDSDRLATQPSLIDMMLWDQFNNGSVGGKAVISLGDLLAFGTGFDTLVWNIRSAPNEFGATNRLAKGVFPVAALRNKVGKIQELRRLLDRKATKFRTECELPATVSVSE